MVGPDLLADRLDHLDRGDPVVAVALVAIVLQADLALLVETGLLNAGLRKIALLPADRQSLHFGAKRLGGDLGKAAPAAADLQELLAGLQVDRFGKPAIFVVLRGRQIRGAVLE